MLEGEKDYLRGTSSGPDGSRGLQVDNTLSVESMGVRATVSVDAAR